MTGHKKAARKCHSNSSQVATFEANKMKSQNNFIQSFVKIGNSTIYLPQAALERLFNIFVNILPMKSPER